MTEMIVPSFAETEITGFIMGFACDHRGKRYECKLFASSKAPVRGTKEGTAITWEKLPAKLRKSVHAFCDSRKPQSVEPDNEDQYPGEDIDGPL